MTIKQFNSLEEIQKYYVKESNVYAFKEDDKYINLVVFNFDLEIEANIDAMDIIAKNITAYDIYAKDINANDINACYIDACYINVTDIEAIDINVVDIDANDIKAYNIIANDINANNIDADNITYYAVCFAYENIKCKSITGIRENHKHFVLDGTLKIENENNVEGDK